MTLCPPPFVFLDGGRVILVDRTASRLFEREKNLRLTPTGLYAPCRAENKMPRALTEGALKTIRDGVCIQAV